MSVGARSLAALLLLLLLGTPDRATAQGVPPDADWRSFQTEHFNVSFVEGIEPFARRAAARAEWAYDLLARDFALPPRGRIELLVADNVDFSNGLATPFPRNRVTVYAQPPASEPTLSYNDDWLQLLMLHELVHVFHLDQAGGVWGELRTIFGRDPSLFPQEYTPGWVVEGLATYLESSYSDAGRAKSALYEMMLRSAILDDRFFPIDRVSLDPVTWPTGNSRYLYGSLFIDHLARRHGAPSVTDFIRRMGAALLPYRPEAAARRAFGTTLSREWEEWEDSLHARFQAQADSVTGAGLTIPDVLTREGRFAQNPRFSPDGSRIVYAANGGRGDAGHVTIDTSGVRLETQRRSSLGPAGWIGDTERLLFAQVDFADPHTLYSDLYVEVGGRVRKVTREARVWDPDPHPDGRSAVAVQSAGGSNRLVRVDLEDGSVRPLTTPTFDGYWSAPRWSPAGDRIAASVWRAGGRIDVVVLDTLGAVVVDVTTEGSIDSDPAWSPDARYVLFSSDRGGIPNLYARELATGRLWQVTNVLTGAFQPDVSRDGRSIVFTLYDSDGYHIARMPFDPAGWRIAAAGRQGGTRSVPVPELPASVAVRSYSAFPSILPTYWTLVADGDGKDDIAIGAALSGEDAIERHSWGAELAVFPADGRIQADANYRYAGWGNPILDLSAGERWRRELDGTGEAEDLLRRTRDVFATLTWLRRRWRSSTSFQSGVDLTDIELARRDDLGEPERDLPPEAGAFVGLGYSTVRGFGLSIGPQEGFSTSARLQARRYLELPDDGTRRGYARVTTRSRAYRGLDWFGFAPPTLAARVDAGFESNAVGPGFSLGGASGESTDLPFEPAALGRALAYPVRGYPVGVQRGNRVVSGSVEYRFPLALIERGFRLFPLAVDRFTGDLFFDGGTAWCEGCPESAVRTPSTPSFLFSTGAEAILTLRVGYFNDVALRLGVAAPLTRGKTVFYLRSGLSF